ncbi:hypothetical protein DAPPUDRAFT_257544 [Daphnia pulex]|uniref:Uncharacterized protein n=1 Tax=Daphnia pulex TaxID=6669 RepID=E9HDT2_DAPPU|nr:hypothetical protein DAPPUDRAFT_257544 [Daphnia pulex]|eukprot:EFX70080.1 hypothetical protein DAPPUDRAFT_257544 [Daphnia pulex]
MQIPLPVPFPFARGSLAREQSPLLELLGGLLVKPPSEGRSPSPGEEWREDNREEQKGLFVNLPHLRDPMHFRPRVCSLPENSRAPYNPRSRDDIYRLRNFSITSKGVAYTLPNGFSLSSYLMLAFIDF